MLPRVLRASRRPPGQGRACLFTGAHSCSRIFTGGASVAARRWAPQAVVKSVVTRRVAVGLVRSAQSELGGSRNCGHGSCRDGAQRPPFGETRCGDTRPQNLRVAGDGFTAPLTAVEPGRREATKTCFGRGCSPSLSGQTDLRP